MVHIWVRSVVRIQYLVVYTEKAFHDTRMGCFFHVFRTKVLIAKS